MRGLVVALGLGACGGAHGPRAVVDPFEDDPVAVLATLEERLEHAQVIDVAGRTAAGVAGEVHVERERVSWVKVRAPRFAKWSSLAPRGARDTDPTVWADSLDKEMIRAGLAPTWDATLRGEDPDIFTGDVDAVLTVDDAVWANQDAHTLGFTLTDEEDGVKAAVLLTLGTDGLPVRRVENDVAETYTRFQLR